MTYRFLLLFFFLVKYSSGQNLITNGSFESVPLWSNWTGSIVGGDLWCGSAPGNCGPSVGTNYSWSGGSNDNISGAGVDNLLEEVYQNVTIPANATVCSLYFDARISTLEGTTTTGYDSLIVGFQNLSGSRFAWWYLTNVNATSTSIPGCGNWVNYAVQVPPFLYGQTLRFFIRHYTDNTLPTIFRVDDFELLASVATGPLRSVTFRVDMTGQTVSPLGVRVAGTFQGWDPASTQMSQSPTNPSIYTYTTLIPQGSFVQYKYVNGNAWGYDEQVPGLCGIDNGLGGFNRYVNVLGDTILPAYLFGSCTNNTPICTYSVSPSSYTFAPSAASNSIANVSTQQGCTWNAIVTSGSSWLSCNSSGSGSGVISATVTANTSPSSRTGYISINGQQLMVIQQGISCTYSLSSNSYSFSSSSASTNVVSNVIAPIGCNWNAIVTSGSSWLSSTSSGSGNGQIIVSVLANSSTTSRTGTINIAGQTLTILQPGLNCTYALSTSNYYCSSSISNNYSAASVIAPSGCSWIATVTSGQGWLSTTSSGSGNGLVIIQVTSNLTTSSRTGTVDVNGQTLTIIQPGLNCTYALSVTNYSCPNNLANVYSGIVNVNTQNGCQWTAIVTSGASWLSTVSSGNGAGPISFSVLANTSGSSRTGIIDVNGSEVSITQPAGGVDVREVSSLSLFEVFPNPTDGIISVNVETSLEQEFNFEILDALGRHIHQSSFTSQVGIPFRAKLDLSSYERGIYLIRLSNRRSEFTSRRIVLK